MRALPELERSADGLPVVSQLERRMALCIVVAATLWFGVLASWELCAPHLAGHYAASASLGIAADNMLRYGIIAPVWEYTPQAPPAALYYCHHPWGIFWVTTLFVDLLGRHDYVCRLPAVLLSTATPALLFLLGRALWRPIAGAAAALMFVALPISLAFANFNALEVPVIAWTTLGCWGFVRHQQTWHSRYLAASLGGFFMALHSDWPAYVCLGALLCFGALRGILFRSGQVRLRPHASWWVLSASLMALTGAFYAVMFHRAGKLADLFQSAEMRSATAAMWPGRPYWIASMFTPLALALGAFGAAVLLLRVLLLRRPLDAVPLCVLVMALFQYLVFRQGADVHIYWPHYFAPFCGLALGALVDTGLRLAEVAKVQRFQPLWCAAGLALALFAAVARDGVQLLGYARASGGRFNEKGMLIHSDGRKTAFLGWLAPRLPERAVVAMHEGMKTTWSQVWTLGGRVVDPLRRRPPEPVEDVWLDDAFVADTRFMLPAMQLQIASRHAVVAVGPFWWLRPSAAHAPIEAFHFVEREPSWWEWYWLGGTEPQRAIEPDPYLTWELRMHFGQLALPPTAPPKGLDQLRVAHNIAVAEARDPSELMQAVLAQLQPIHAELDDGTEIVGSHFADGVRPVLTLIYRAAGPSQEDVMPAVRARVVALPRWSTTMADPIVREVAVPLAIAPRSWRAGFLYSHAVDVRKRPGRERFELYFQFRTPPPEPASGQSPPKLASGADALVLLEL